MNEKNKRFLQLNDIFYKSCILYLLIFSGFTTLLFPQSQTIPFIKENGFPFIQNFSYKEYNAHQQNWAVIQDQRGIMYFGNVAGVLEYDGVSWRLIPLPNKSLGRSLAVDSNGTVYVGAHGDFGYLAPDINGRTVYKSLLDEVPKEDRNFNNIWKIHVASDGIYFRSSSHIFRWSNKQMTVWKPRTEFHRSFFVNNTLYVRQWDLGLYQIVGDSLSLAPGGELFADQRIDIMLSLAEEQILIGTRTKGLFLYSQSSLKPFKSEVNEFLKDNLLYDGYILSDGTIALATLQGGLAIIDQLGYFLLKIDKSAGLRDNTIWALSPDQDGGLWLALNDGLGRIELPSPFSLYQENLGIQSNVESIIRHKGKIYVATGLGVYSLRPSVSQGESSEFYFVPGISSQVWYLLPTPLALLAATSSGVYQINKNKVSPLVDLVSFTLFRSRSDTNRVYVGLIDGLAVLEIVNGQWEYRGRIEGITEEIRSIVEDNEKKIWMGTQFQGVIHINEPNDQILPGKAGRIYKIEKYGPENKLPEGEVTVYWANEQVLFATAEGLCIFDNENSHFIVDPSFGDEASDTSYTINRIAVDQDHNIWLERGLGNNFEIGKLSLEEDENYHWNSYSLPRLSVFGPAWAIYPDHTYKSIIWFGGNGWIARYNKSKDRSFENYYNAMIRRVTVKGDSLIYGGFSKKELQGLETIVYKQQVDYENNELRFEYAAQSYNASSLNQYQYFLEGFDKNWSTWTEETKKDYTNLPEGDYLFHVKAKNVYQQLSNEDTFAFTILPPWYRTWWAYILYLLAIGSIVFGFIRLQINHIRSREREKAELKQAHILKQKNMELKEKNTQLEFVLQKLQIAQNSLIDSESRFRSVAESANDAIITADNKGKITYWNKRAVEIFGYSKEEIFGKPLTILMPNRHQEAHEKGFENYQKTGHGQIIGQIVDIQAVHKNGKEFPIELTLGTWETPEARFVTGIVRDVTKRKQEEEALQYTKTQLMQSEKMATLGKLSAGMAHELNNPASVALRGSKKLQNINSQVENLFLELGRMSLSENQYETFNRYKNKIHIDNNLNQLDPITRSDRENEIEIWLMKKNIDISLDIIPVLVNLNFTNDDLIILSEIFKLDQLPVILSSIGNLYISQNLLEEISQGTERITEIIRSLKSYSYMDKAKLQLINIHDGLEDTLIMLRSQLKDGIIVQKEFDENLPLIEAYGSELNQVWTNIIDNAISAMNGKGKINIKTFMEDEEIVVQIEDSGPGIPTEIQGNIFDPFFTTKPQGEGTGLGLNISYNIIVKKHKGKISFHTGGNGTCFEVRLPAGK